MELLIINGPNLNILGTRQPEIYGHETMESCLEMLKRRYPGIKLTYFQSNSEGDIIDRIQSTALGRPVDGIILNAGAYTHTSLAIADAIASVKTPVVEVHLSNVMAREEIRRRSLIGPVCRGSIAGFGLDSYRLAVESFIKTAE